MQVKDFDEWFTAVRESLDNSKGKQAVECKSKQGAKLVTPIASALACRQTWEVSPSTETTTCCQS